MPEPDLTTLRTTIDQIDEQIIELLAQRFAATDSVGKLKAHAGLAAVDETREQSQQERYIRLAKEKGVSPTLVLGIFRAVVNEVVANHRSIARKAAI